MPNSNPKQCFHRSTSDSENSAWTKYLNLIKERPWEFADRNELRIVTDRQTVRTYENEKNCQIGVVYESPFRLMVVDLVEDGLGNRFEYERLVPVASGRAAVVVPLFNGRFVLLEQFRHALRSRQLAFPRGFGETGLTARENACKELHEELHARVDPEAMCDIGSIIADSGLSGQKVAVFTCDIDEYSFEPGYEGIYGVDLLSPKEMKLQVAEGKITDGYTLSALTLYDARHS